MARTKITPLLPARGAKRNERKRLRSPRRDTEKRLQEEERLSSSEDGDGVGGLSRLEKRVARVDGEPGLVAGGTLHGLQDVRDDSEEPLTHVLAEEVFEAAREGAGYVGLEDVLALVADGGDTFFARLAELAAAAAASTTYLPSLQQCGVLLCAASYHGLPRTAAVAAAMCKRQGLDPAAVTTTIFGQSGGSRPQTSLTTLELCEPCVQTRKMEAARSSVIRAIAIATASTPANSQDLAAAATSTAVLGCCSSDGVCSDHHLIM